MKDTRTLIKYDLAHLAKSMSFVVIRNFEFLFNNRIELPNDVDLFVLTFKESWSHVLEKSGFFLMSKSKHRATFAKIYGSKLITLDFHIETLTGNYVSYGIEEVLLRNSSKKEGIPIPSKEDHFCALLMRELIAEGFKQKYRKVLYSLSKDINENYILEFLREAFGRKKAYDTISLVKKGSFDRLEELRSGIIAMFVVKNLPSYIKALVTLKRPRTKIVSIVGVDGSGKSTISKECAEFLSSNMIKANLLYMGRGNKNVLPVQKTGSILKSSIEKSPNLLKKIIYSLGAVAYSVDFWIRYLFHILPMKRQNQYIIADRYTSDILLMQNVPRIIRQILYLLLPKPDDYVYLYTGLSAIKKRRSDHDIVDIKRQLSEFTWINKLLNPLKIENKEVIHSRDAVIKYILTSQ